MAARTSGGLITFGIINILVALLPMCCTSFGSFITVGQMQGNAPMDVNGRDIGPQLRQHVERNVPGVVPEAFLHAGFASFFALLLLIGAIGLFLTQQWARWLTVAASVLLILTMCVHDVYQLGFLRPAVVTVIDQNVVNMPNDQRAGFKAGFTFSYFFWSCTNPLLMIYLFAMSLFLCVTGAFRDVPEDVECRPVRRLRRRDYDDDGDDDEDYRPRRRGRDDDDDDDYQPRRRRRSYDDDDY